MNSLLRFGFAITLVAAIGTGIVISKPQFLENMGVDVYNLPNLYAGLNRLTVQSKDLENTLLTQSERAKKKQQAIIDYISEEISIADAAEQIRELSDPEKIDFAFYALEIEGKDREEREYRLILYWLSKLQEKTPSQELENAIARLNMEIAIRSGQPTNVTLTQATTEPVVAGKKT